jgi:integrase
MKKPVPPPTLRQFEEKFNRWVRENCDNERTQQYYVTNYQRLLEYVPLANCRVDQVDEPVVEQYKSFMLGREEASKTTINHYLRCLKKCLRYAWRMKLRPDQPTFPLFTEGKGREFIFDDQTYTNWLAASPSPLYEASVLARECGICRGEMLALQRDCIEMLEEPDEDDLYGELDIRRGLKRSYRRRKLRITAAMREALLPLLRRSQCEYVFTSLDEPSQPLSVNTLSDQCNTTRYLLKLPFGVGLHAFRHTFLTEMARIVDPFTLQKIAGHANIATTMKYVYVQQDAIRQAFSAKPGHRPPKSPPTSEALGRRFASE